jgi:hypothetical protein
MKNNIGEERDISSKNGIMFSWFAVLLMFLYSRGSLALRYKYIVLFNSDPWFYWSNY